MAIRMRWAEPPWCALIRRCRSAWAYLQNAIGGVSGPFDSFLTLRGIKTLALRMERIALTGRQLPSSRRSREGPQGVLSRPGQSPPNMRLRSGRWWVIRWHVTAELRGSLEDCPQSVERCELFRLAESSRVESLIEHPGLMTHAFAAAGDAGVAGDQ